MSQYSEKKIMTFQERFRGLCNENEKNATALAKELNVSKQTISAWKNGTRSPKAPVIQTIARYFNVRIEWLMGFDVEREAPRPAVSIPDSKVFTKLLNAMTPSEYYQFTELLNKVEQRLKEKGEL